MVKFDTQTLIARSVKAHVLDEYEVLLPWPLQIQTGADLDNVELKFRRVASKISDVRDSRKGCATPEIHGDFEYFEVTRATLSGSLINIEGRRSTPEVRIADSGKNCAMLGTVSHGSNTLDYFGAFIPPQIVAGKPLNETLVSHGIGTGEAWDFVFSPQ